MKRSHIAERTQYLCLCAVIAALYVVLTLISYALGLANLAIQVRISEALCVLVCFTPAAIPGVTLGCLLSNFIMGLPLPDIVFGTLASFIGVLIGALLKKHAWAVPIPTVLANTLIIPFVLKYAYGLDGTVIFFMITVGLGEIVSAGLFGTVLFKALKKSHIFGHRLTKK